MRPHAIKTDAFGVLFWAFWLFFFAFFLPENLGKTWVQKVPKKVCINLSSCLHANLWPGVEISEVSKAGDFRTFNSIQSIVQLLELKKNYLRVREREREGERKGGIVLRLCVVSHQSYRLLCISSKKKVEELRTVKNSLTIKVATCVRSYYFFFQSSI